MFAKLSTEEELQAAFHGENNLDDDVQKHENTLLSIAKDAVSVGKILYGVKDFVGHQMRLLKSRHQSDNNL